MSAFRGPAPRCDAAVLLGLQTLVTAMPLALGGRETWAQAGAAGIAAALLCLWLYKTTCLEGPTTPRAVRAPLALLLAFSGLVLLQTIPLPSAALATVSPRAHELFTTLLPGWPDGGGWRALRPLALEPFAAQAGLLRFGPAFAVFAILAAYPWGAGAADRDARRLVFGRLVATLCLGATVLGALALRQHSTGDDSLLGIFTNPYGHDRYAGRAHGPYVNPNHLAGYLEMLIPLGAFYVVALATRLRRRLEHRTDAARRIALARHRTWIEALIGAQHRLILPLIALAGLGVMLLAHRATDSSGGRVALAVAALVCVRGLVRRRTPAAKRAALRPVTAALGVVALVTALVGQLVIGSGEEVAAGRSIDPSLGARLIAISQASPLLREFPLLGTGLGSWPHAFRLKQRPPIEHGRWSHAHNDYLQFGVETGLAWMLLLAGFAWACIRAARRTETAAETEAATGTDLVATGTAEPARGVRRLEATSDWIAAFGDWRLLRTGLAAGAIALLVHSLSDFNLQIPANALIFMTLLGLLVSSAAARSQPMSGRVAWAPAGLIAVLALAVAGPVLGLAPFRVAGGASAWARMDEAYTRLAVNGEREAGVALARSAVELAPLEPDTHELLGRLVADPAEGDAAYRRAIWLSPDEAPLRDALALRLWQRGDRAQALIEFEKSMQDAPALAAHDYLAPGNGLDPTTPEGRLRALAAGDSPRARLTSLDPAIRDAIERGLRRALDDGDTRDYAATVTDLATLLEAGGRSADAAALLEQSAGSALGEDGYRRRAAADYLAAGNVTAAERVLTEQLTRTPDDGELYRLLAVDVYAARYDFDAADVVLEAGQRNSADLLPIYRAMREVLALEQYRVRTAEPRAVAETNEVAAAAIPETPAAATRDELQ